MSKYGKQNTVKEVMLIFAQNLRKIRKNKKLTQKELSSKSGVAYASVKKFETTGIISLESFLKLVDAVERLSEFELLLLENNLEEKRSLFDI